MLQIDGIFSYIDHINMGALDLNLLVAFEALMQERSVSGAATRLGLGQPAASHALARLRAQFDDELFTRQGRTMVPTARAIALADPIGRALAAAREALQPASPFDPATSRRTFTLSGGDFAMSTILPGLIAALRTTAPNVDLRFRFLEKDQVEKRLDDGTLDLALGVFPAAAKRFETRQVLQERFVCVARREHPVFAGSFSAQAYAAAPHLLVTERGDDVGVVDEALAALGLRRRIVLAAPSVLMVRRLVRGSDLVATIGARVAAGFAGDPELRVAPPPLDLSAWRLQLLIRRARPLDSGLAWLISQILAVSTSEPAGPSTL
jgi:DNA-binding transcriptional LysR family regulator